MRVQSLGWEDPLEKEMATHCSILVWETPWTEETGRLQSMGSPKSWSQLSDLAAGAGAVAAASDYMYLYRGIEQRDLE